MKRTKSDARHVIRALCLVLVLLLPVALLASCGGAKVEEQSKKSGSVKTPPGVTESQAGESSMPKSSTNSSTPAEMGDQSQSTTSAQTQVKTPSVSADLVGGRFTLVNATRPDTNKSVISSSGREVKGDYLEAEFTIQDVGTDLIDLSAYSFRLESPGIAADTYADYYGETGTYGKYVSENEISATLMDYANLQAVIYKVKVGELVDKVFVFFDLNPENVARNPNVTKDNTSLVIRKVSGTDYGDEVTIPLTGYPD